jgi:hypothetical protein
VQLDQQDLGFQAQHVSLFAHLNAVGVVQVRVHPALVAEHNSSRKSTSSTPTAELGRQEAMHIKSIE